MHKVNVAISYGNESRAPGVIVDLSAWPADDISRLEQDWHVVEGAFAIECVADAPAEAIPAPERLKDLKSGFDIISGALSQSAGMIDAADKLKEGK